MDNGTLSRIEEQRLELEQNVAKLRKSLRYWQTLEIDYEGLKEEFQGLPDDTPSEECFQAAKDFKPELVDEKELESLFEPSKSRHKRPSQLVKIFSDRVDYVTRNISTIRKQLSATERKRNALLLGEDPESQEDAGLPLSEITEELDDEDKIISSKVQAPGRDTPGIVDVLRKAGVTDLGDDTGPKRDDVEFDDDTDEDDINVPKSFVSSEKVEPSSSQTVSSSASRVTELSDSGDDAVVKAKIGPLNSNDNEEDDALRREMLQYNLGEVGAIVAELDLEESADHSYDENDHDDDEDYLSDYDEDEDLYTDESEDEKGATKTPVITERYKRQMEALSKKHGISGLTNLGPEPDLSEEITGQLNRPPPAEAARKAAIARAEVSEASFNPTKSQDSGVEEPQKKKKSVAFAPSLDIAQEMPHPETPTATSEPVAHPVGETVLERAPDQAAETVPPNSAQPPSRPIKISRFKATRSATPQTPVFPPPQMDFPPASSTQTSSSSNTQSRPIISPNLVERPATQTAPPSDPSELNPELHRREVAIEYQKIRNRKIHEQGGYVRGGAEENYGEETAPDMVVDEETGKARKVSRFKAARLNQS